ncbi:type II toxin-antitoxin system HicB family antitoxin [candidate division WOR-3 bacterium]|nr:type II toxin-antitoxin system HicB family antitoxin [candidate division WOR-3 bacterium]
MTKKYHVIIEPETDPQFIGYYNARCPALPGCVSYGKSYEEAERNIQDAIQSYINSLLKHNESIPEETGLQVKIVEMEVAVPA